MEKQLEKARVRTVAEHDFPKLAEHVGSTPRIKDNPPLIFHHPALKQYEGSEELKAAGTFDEAICDFAGDYADQAERDHKAFVKAIRERRVKAVVES